MSILANLLKKTEPNQAKAEIPPGVLQAVSSSNTGGDRRRYYLIGGIAVAAIAVGALLGIYLNTRPAPVRPAARPQPLPQTEPVAAVQPPLSSSMQPLVAAASAPVPDQTVQKPVRPAARPVRVAQAMKRSAPAEQPASPPERTAAPRDRSIVDAHLFAARNAEARRDYLTALNQYQKALEADPDNYRIMNNVASTMLRLGMDAEALQVANRALSTKPDYVSAIINAGIAHGNLGHAAASRGMFTKAVTLDPSNRSALYNLALSQERAGTLDDALKTYRRLAEGGDAQGYLGQGRLYEQQGNKREALKVYRELTALPDSGQRPKDLARERIKMLDQ